MMKHFKITHSAFVAALFLSANAPVYADGLVEGMADGLNDMADAFVKAADSAAVKIKENVGPTAKKVGENVDGAVYKIADAISDAAARVKLQMSGSEEK